MSNNPYSPYRLHDITINWSNPIAWDNISGKEWKCGWYYITRHIHRNGYDVVTPIYIGKAKGVISKRVLHHSLVDSNSRFLEKRGEFKVRFGQVISPDNFDRRYHINRLLLTVESALITEVQPICNISQTGKYRRWYRLRINNVGKHDQIPSIIDNREHDNAKEPPVWWDGEFEQ